MNAVPRHLTVIGEVRFYRESLAQYLADTSDFVVLGTARNVTEPLSS